MTLRREMLDSKMVFPVTDTNVTVAYNPRLYPCPNIYVGLVLAYTTDHALQALALIQRHTYKYGKWCDAVTTRDSNTQEVWIVLLVLHL